MVDWDGEQTGNLDDLCRRQLCRRILFVGVDVFHLQKSEKDGDRHLCRRVVFGLSMDEFDVWLRVFRVVGAQLFLWWTLCMRD